MENKTDWGYPYDGRIYIHFDKCPDIDKLKFFKSVELIRPMELPDEVIHFKYVTVLNNFRHGGATSHLFAEPILSWKKIK